MSITYCASQRRGQVLIFAMVGMVAFSGFCMLAVDWGRVQLTKTELQSVADAAARYAATGVSDGTTYSKATWVASRNTADGSPVNLSASDVTWGHWDTTTNTFSPGGTPANAVRVIARRTAASGGAVQLSFGNLIGISSQDVTATAVATAAPGVEYYGVIGLNGIAMGGNTTIAYWSTSGTTDATQGNIASNGPITLNGSSYINGNARPGAGFAVSAPSKVSGSTNPLTNPLSFPNGDAGLYAYYNNNASMNGLNNGTSNFTVNNGSATIPGGTYYVKNFSVNSSSTLNFTGPTTIYCYGTFSMSGSASTSGSTASNLTIIMCPSTSGAAPGSVTIGSSAALYATIYAPQSDVTLSGTGDIYGSVLGRTVNMTGTSAIHYDLALGAGTASAQGLVQ